MHDQQLSCVFWSPTSSQHLQKANLYGSLASRQWASESCRKYDETTHVRQVTRSDTHLPHSRLPQNSGHIGGSQKAIHHCYCVHRHEQFRVGPAVVAERSSVPRCGQQADLLAWRIWPSHRREPLITQWLQVCNSRILLRPLAGALAERRQGWPMPLLMIAALALWLAETDCCLP